MLKSKQNDGRAHVRPMSSLYLSYPAILPPSSCVHQTPQKLPPRRAESFAPREAELELSSQGIMGNPVALAKPDSVCVCCSHQAHQISSNLIKSHQISSNLINPILKILKSSSEIIQNHSIQVPSITEIGLSWAQLGCPTPATSCFSSCGARSRLI